MTQKLNLQKVYLPRQEVMAGIAFRIGGINYWRVKKTK